MRRLSAILILAVFVGLTALTSLDAGSTKFVFTWMNPNYSGAHFKTILVLGINGKAVNRAEFEDQLSAGITRPGIVAIPSYSLLPRPNSTPLDMNQLRDVVQGQNIDAIVASRLIKVKKSVTEIPGQIYTRIRITTRFTDITARSTRKFIPPIICEWREPRKSKPISIQR